MQVAARDLVILPVPLRAPALAMRNQTDYARLWPAVQRFNRAGGLPPVGNLVTFYTHYRSQLDRFVAEFESVRGQVGAIVFVAGVIAGIERAPSHEYWGAVWEPLVRTCYGAHAVEVARRTKRAPGTRLPLRTDGVTSLDGLAAALEETERAEATAACDVVGALPDDPFTCDTDERAESFTVETFGNRGFAGQIVRDRDNDRVVYASLVATGRR
jgi:hypothetical protein